MLDKWTMDPFMLNVFRAQFWRSMAISLTLLSTPGFAQPLIIGAYQYPPFMDEKSNNGLYFQLIELIAAHTKLDLKWVFYPYARLDYFFHQGKVDIEVGSSPEWHINKPTPGLFTDAFYSIEDVAVYRSTPYKGAPERKATKDQTIGIVRGYHYPIFDQVLAKTNIKKVERADENALLKLLINERIQQVFINKQVFEYLHKNNPEYRQLKIADTVGKYHVAIRVHPDHAELIPVLNLAIKDLKANGSIQQLFEANF